MNIQNILNLLHEADPEVYDRLSPRRQVLKNFSSKVAAAAVPFALGSMFKKAYGKTNDVLYTVLTFALKLEYLEDEFYRTVALQSPVLTPEATAMFTKISADETAHVKFLQNVIDSSGSYVIPAPTFDFTGGAGNGNGPYKNYPNELSSLLMLAQAFEDLGVRAYKGQAGYAQANNEIVTAALCIHSVEARHAARIRMMRTALNTSKVKPWVYGDFGEVHEPTLLPVYSGELSTTQAGMEIIQINGMLDVDKYAAAEAFDEPFLEDKVEAIIAPFIKKTP